MTKRVRVYTAEQRLANRVREKARYEANREKIQARKKVYREANPEKAAASAKAYREANREKAAARNKAYYVGNREKAAASAKAWCKANREKAAASAKTWCKANPEKKAAQSKKYYEANREKLAAQTKAYREENPEKRAANLACRRVKKLQRSLPCLNAHDLSEIRKCYRVAGQLRKAGWHVHVDHIVPLQGKDVSGLHAPWNLKIISGTDNLRKHIHWSESEGLSSHQSFEIEECLGGIATA